MGTRNTRDAVYRVKAGFRRFASAGADNAFARTFATKEAAILAQRFECATKYASPIRKSTTSTTSPSAISVSQVIGSPPRQIASYRRSH